MEYEKVRAIIAEQFNVPAEEISAATAFIEDLGMDSIEILQLILKIEKEFDIELNDLRPEMMFTVGDAVNYISQIIR